MECVICSIVCLQADATTPKSNEPQSSCSSLYVQPPDFTNTKVRHRLDDANEPTAHIVPKALYRPHADAMKAAPVQRNEYAHASNDRQPTPSPSPLGHTTKLSGPHDSRDATPSHPTAYPPSDRTKPALFNPLQPQHADKPKYHMVHKSFDDLYQRSATMSPLHNQYLPVPANLAGRDLVPVAVQGTHAAKPPQRHFESFGVGGKAPMPTMSTEPRKSNDLTIYPRSQSANLFYHEQNRIKPMRDLPTSNAMMNAYNYPPPPPSAAKPHDYYYQMNAAQSKWSNQSRITQSPITTTPSPHSLGGPGADALSHSPISASPLPYPMHRQNPSVTIRKI